MTSLSISPQSTAAPTPQVPQTAEDAMEVEMNFGDVLEAIDCSIITIYRSENSMFRARVICKKTGVVVAAHDDVREMKARKEAIMAAGRTRNFAPTKTPMQSLEKQVMAQDEKIRTLMAMVAKLTGTETEEVEGQVEATVEKEPEGMSLTELAADAAPPAGIEADDEDDDDLFTEPAETPPDDEEGPGFAAPPGASDDDQVASDFIGAQ